MRIATIFAITLFGSISTSAMAQLGAATIASAPGMIQAERSAKLMATITAIDPATRNVSLRGESGETTSLVLGPEVRNFDQLKVGDRVNADYVERLVIELKKDSKAPVGRVEEGVAGRAAPGASPGGAVGRKVTIVADVIATDPAKNTVTLKGPERTLELAVRDPAQFARITKGDQVEATYTEGLAITVQPAGK